MVTGQANRPSCNVERAAENRCLRVVEVGANVHPRKFHAHRARGPQRLVAPTSAPHPRSSRSRRCCCTTCVHRFAACHTGKCHNDGQRVVIHGRMAKWDLRTASDLILRDSTAGRGWSASLGPRAARKAAAIYCVAQKGSGALLRAGLPAQLSADSAPIGVLWTAHAHTRAQGRAVYYSRYVRLLHVLVSRRHPAPRRRPTMSHVIVPRARRRAPRGSNFVRDGGGMLLITCIPTLKQRYTTAANAVHRRRTS